MAAVRPWHVAGPEIHRLWFDTTPAAAQPIQLVAEVDGRLVASATGGIEISVLEKDVGGLGVSVHPDARGRGIGTALHTRVLDHLASVGAHRLVAIAVEEPATMTWAAARGYTPKAQQRFLTVDPRQLPPQPATPPGVTIQTAAEAGPAVVHAVDDAASVDEPGDLTYAGVPYDEWLARTWPGFDHEISLVAYVDGQPAAISLLDANYDTGRALSVGSSTLPAYRGRGLIKLLKSVSLRAAADRGLRDVITGNDSTNAPMLAINQWLGYREFCANRTMHRLV